VLQPCGQHRARNAEKVDLSPVTACSRLRRSHFAFLLAFFQSLASKHHLTGVHFTLGTIPTHRNTQTDIETHRQTQRHRLIDSSLVSTLHWGQYLQTHTETDVETHRQTQRHRLIDSSHTRPHWCPPYTEDNTYTQTDRHRNTQTDTEIQRATDSHTD